MPPKRGRGARAAAQSRGRAARSEASNESVHVENPEVVAPAGQPQVNGPAANEMAMFEEFRRFQQFMRRAPSMREAPEVNAPHRDGPEMVAPPQHQPPPPPPPYPMQTHPMHVHGLGTTYLDAIRYLKDVSMKFFDGKSDPVSAYNWRKKLERNLDSVRCPQEYRKELGMVG
ncbi:unnamed protein product [Arabidopsis arenosa]|uniref:Uncharacterized protein n=1 Tax=Arabidopsis arenosa TaxID=38785 RepID=A0A8S2AK26_ARAAE|nr:unnamed protein product [Arabidopsis arenosa]